VQWIIEIDQLSRDIDQKFSWTQRSLLERCSRLDDTENDVALQSAKGGGSRSFFCWLSTHGWSQRWRIDKKKISVVETATR
jgi:hypothetical protein